MRTSDIALLINEPACANNASKGKGGFKGRHDDRGGYDRGGKGRSWGRDDRH